MGERGHTGKVGLDYLGLSLLMFKVITPTRG